MHMWTTQDSMTMVLVINYKTVCNFEWETGMHIHNQVM